MNINQLIKQSGFSKSCDGTDCHVGDYENFKQLIIAIRVEALKDAENQVRKLYADELKRLYKKVAGGKSD